LDSCFKRITITILRWTGLWTLCLWIILCSSWILFIKSTNNNQRNNHLSHISSAWIFMIVIFMEFLRHLIWSLLIASQKDFKENRYRTVMKVLTMLLILNLSFINRMITILWRWFTMIRNWTFVKKKQRIALTLSLLRELTRLQWRETIKCYWTNTVLITNQCPILLFLLSTRSFCIWVVLLAQLV
jgi:hypothetical protein